jgi:23S rRNA (cytosine1962-C5)-methyltransferase
VVNKPAGWNTHAPSSYAGEGLYDWLKHREPRWASLAIIHRLDKDTSGVLVFGKTPLANRSLTEQFTHRAVKKTYLLLTDRAPKQREFVVQSNLFRAGDRYVSGPHGEPAETKFQVGQRPVAIGHPCERPPADACAVMAEPLTGRTHQIRVHAAEQGFPILGDTLYGGAPWPRVCLHAAELRFRHPATGEAVVFSAPVDFAADARRALRRALIEPETTDAFRLVHGASDGCPGWYVEQLGAFLLAQTGSEWPAELPPPLRGLFPPRAPRTTYYKRLSHHVRGATVRESSPRLVLGEAAPERFTIRENGVRFELSFHEGYSVGLFLDQRDNRRRLLTGHVAAGFALLAEGRVAPAPDALSTEAPGTRATPPSRGWEVLNCFAYTCGFSVCAALAGARATSLDLSKKYLEWGRRNFALNDLDPAAHDFIYGDTFDWLKRLARKQRAFDAVLLDPPTFSQSKAGGVFRAEKDYGRLVSAALPVLKPGGVLFASTNAAEWQPEAFVAEIERAVRAAGRSVRQRHYAPQPPDFPVSRAEPAHLKTLWLRLA